MHRKIVRRQCPESGLEQLGLPDFLRRIYLSRGISRTEELELNLSGLQDVALVKGMPEAVNLLVESVMQGQRILIIGDFDADGATSTALALSALRAMGAKHCNYLVPNRFEFGYGLTPEIVELAREQNPDLIVTVDNGISSHEGVAYAKSLGMRVLVTDHHLPGDALPEADAIVNPNQPGCEFGSKNAAGVGVIFYVMCGLRARLRQLNWFSRSGISEPNMGEFLDLVALGTVADLVPLDRNNRILVNQGILRIRAGKARPGINALLACAGKKPSNLVTSDLGFIVGPRLNAAGRLDDMSLGIECLMAPDLIVANELAESLDKLNHERKNIEQQMKRDADEQLRQLDVANTAECWGVCLYDRAWHQGVIGILASRIKEKLYRPVIVFSEAEDFGGEGKPDRLLKGSARSIPGLHMRDALDLVAKRNPHLLKKFGGHAMAAGMTIEYRHLNEFRDAFDAVVRDRLSPSDLDAVILSDGTLDDAELNLDSVMLLNQSGPWGQQFPEPVFDDVFEIVQHRVLKERHLKLVVRRVSGATLLDAIMFNSEWVREALPQRVRLAYRPNVNEFRGNRSVQLLVDQIEAA